MPLPSTGMTTVLPPTNVTVPFTTPKATGSNFVTVVAFAPGARLSVSPDVMENGAPLAVAVPPTSVISPVFVTPVDTVTLVFVFTEPKLIDGLDSAIAAG